MSVGGTTKNENDRPPFDKGGLQGGTHWARADLPLIPSLCKEGGFSEELQDADKAFSDGELFAVELCRDGRTESALILGREPKTRQKDISSAASLSRLFLRKLK